jgi:hypothetical protein
MDRRRPRPLFYFFEFLAGEDARGPSAPVYNILE